MAPFLLFSFAAAGITGAEADAEGDEESEAFGSGFGSGLAPQPVTRRAVAATRATSLPRRML